MSHPIPGGEVSVTKDTQVVSFICIESRTWDLNSLQSFISVEDLNVIRDTYIGDSMCEDRPIWPVTKNWLYSVKIGYHWEHARINPPVTQYPYSSLAIPSRLWKLIWNLERTILHVEIHPLCSPNDE